MMTDELQGVGGAAGLCQRLGNQVNDLIETSKALREALTHRRADDVWTLLEKQEQEAGKLQQSLQLWSELFADRQALPGSEEASARQEVHGLLARLRNLQRGNAMLARCFLTAVQRAVGTVGRRAAGGRRSTYNRRGRSGGFRPSMLVNQAG